MLSGRDSFADIERVKRDLDGAHQNLENVFSRVASKYTSQPATTIPSSGGYYPSTVVQNSPYTGSGRTYPITHQMATQGRSLSPTPRVSSHSPVVIRSGPSHQISSANYTTTVSRPTEVLVSPLKYTSGQTYTVSQGTTLPTTTTTTTIFSNGGGMGVTGGSRGGGDIEEMIFNTIEEYVEGRTKIVGEAGKQRISKMLLPPEVHFLYSQQRDVTKDFMDILSQEKKAVRHTANNRYRRILTSS